MICVPDMLFILNKQKQGKKSLCQKQEAVFRKTLQLTLRCDVVKMADLFLSPIKFVDSNMSLIGNYT